MTRKMIGLPATLALVATACATAQSPQEAQTPSDNGATVTTAPTAVVTATMTTAPTAAGTAPTTTAPTTTEAIPASDEAVPDGYPIPLPPGGDVTDVTEEIENNYGTDELVTRLNVWYDGNRLDEFALFYASWILDNGNTVLDARSDEGLASFSGYLPPDNDTYGVTVGRIGDATLVQTQWSRPPG